MNQPKQSDDTALPKKIVFYARGTKAIIKSSVVPDKPLDFHEWFTRYVPIQAKRLTNAKNLTEFLTNKQSNKIRLYVK